MDQQLAERCLNGEPEAWETLVRTYYRRIYNLAYRFTGRFDTAEELAQDAFVKIYQNLGSFRADCGSLQSWIMRVGRNQIIDQYRHTRWQKNVSGSDHLEMTEFQDRREPRADDAVYQKEKTELLLQAVHSLPEDLRQAVLLRDLEEMTYQEIADLLKIPAGTVKSRINRGRIELTRLLADRRRHFDVSTGGKR